MTVAELIEQLKQCPQDMKVTMDVRGTPVTAASRVVVQAMFAEVVIA